MFDNIPSVSDTVRKKSARPTLDRPSSEPPVNKNKGAETGASLVGNFHLHNLQKVELGIDLNEPVSISQAEFVPKSNTKLTDSQRPYQHDFEWYQDYYDSIGDQTAAKKVQLKLWSSLLPICNIFTEKFMIIIFKIDF